MSNRNYNEDAAIQNAIAPPLTTHWNTARSGLQVDIGKLGDAPWADENIVGPGRKGVKINIDGYVDYADAMQLETFFGKLKTALQPYY